MSIRRFVTNTVTGHRTVTLSTIASIAAIITMVYFIDNRYATAAEMNDKVQQLEQILSDQLKQNHKQLLQFQIEQLNDRIFLIELKKQLGNSDPIDDVLIKRYENRKKELESQF